MLLPSSIGGESFTIYLRQVALKREGCSRREFNRDVRLSQYRAEALKRISNPRLRHRAGSNRCARLIG
jgi:hypothetical protein